MFIRESGDPAEYERHWYTKLDIEGWSYWTMGAPLDETILINRARLDGLSLDPERGR
jgi:hypothetical protein